MKLKKTKILLFVLFLAGIIKPQVIKTFHERIFTSVDGSAKVEWNIKADFDSMSQVILPFNFKTAAGFTLNGQPGNEISISEINNAQSVTIKTEGLKNKKELNLTFSIKEFLNIEKAEKKEFGNMVFKNKFVNTSGLMLKDFRSEIILPEGYVVTSVDESTPKASPNKPDSPFEVIYVDKKHGVAIKNSSMKIGDNAAITFKTKKENKSRIFLAVLLLAGAGYLFYFRDILKNSENGAQKNRQG